ncbi:MAG: helix-turn-helix domain-containing protein [Proteobacteria bacterium]|nr:helix-turn-helix domain-containing protein [Pseudomonadota bacterium]
MENMIDGGVGQDSPRKATLSVEQAAKILGISRSSAFQAAANGELPVIRIGRRLLVPHAALAELLSVKAERRTA